MVSNNLFFKERAIRGPLDLKASHGSRVLVLVDRVDLGASCGEGISRSAGIAASLIIDDEFSDEHAVRLLFNHRPAAGVCDYEFYNVGRNQCAGFLKFWVGIAWIANTSIAAVSKSGVNPVS